MVTILLEVDLRPFGTNAVYQRIGFGEHGIAHHEIVSY